MSTCETTRVVDELETPQATFNEHAAEQHEVVLKRLEESLDGRFSVTGKDVGAPGPEPPGADRNGCGSR